MKRIFLSHTINTETPTYGGRTKAELTALASINSGDAANNTAITMSLHTGTHVDMPRHFYADGQDISAFDAGFWFFDHPLCLYVRPEGHIIKDELISILTNIPDKDTYDCLIVRTGFDRYDRAQLMENYGFHMELAEYIRGNFPSVRLFGFDTMSVSSFAERMEGRKAHKAFLAPEHPLILLEDMMLKGVELDKISRLIVSPIRVDNADGLPCTVIGELID